MRLTVQDANTISGPDPIQAAIDSASDGDSLYFPEPAMPYRAPSGGWTIRKSLTLFGDGPGPAGVAISAALTAFDKNSPVFEIVPPTSNVHIHDLQLQGASNGTAGPNGVGIRCRSDTSNPTMSANVRLRRLQLMGFPSHGIHLEGLNAGTARVDGATIEGCRVRNCGSAGIQLKNVVEAYLANVIAEGNALPGLSAEGGRVGVYVSIFDGNCTTATGSNDGNLKFKSCQIARVDASRFVNFNVGTIKKACVIEGGIAIVASCYFDSGSATNVGQGIVAANASGVPLTGPVAILGNRYKKTATLVSIGSNAVDCTVFPQYDESGGGSLGLPSPNNGMLAIPHVVRSGSGSSLSGLIIPSGPQDPGPTESADGMMAYNTQLQKLRVRIDGQWKTVVTAP